MYGELGYAAAYVHLFYVLSLWRGMSTAVLMCDIWINVLLHTSALVGPLHIVNWNARWNSEILSCLFEKLNIVSNCSYQVTFFPNYVPLIIHQPISKTFSAYRRLGGHQCRSERMRKISSVQGFDPRNVHPVANHYTNWAFPALS
jgi:hypothetical protein